MRIIALTLLVATLVTGAARAEVVNDFAKGDRKIVLTETATTGETFRTIDPSWKHDVLMAQNSAPGTVTVAPSESQPNTTTTVTVRGGDLAAKILDWFWVAFGGSIGLLGTAVLYKIFGYFGIQTTEMQRAQLQAVIVNGLNAGAAKAQAQLRGSDKLDLSVKNQVVIDAIAYTQAHAQETIKALGLDPKSGDAVDAIRARIETALNDPASPTPAAITPPEGRPAAVAVSAPKAI